MTTPDINQLPDLLRAESDRGAALLAASAINEILKDRLLEHFRHRKPGKELLGDANAPLAGLSAAAKACRALDLVTESQYRRLLVIRQVRNDFAHNCSDIDFESAPLRRAVATLGEKGETQRLAFEEAVINLVGEISR